MKGCKTKSLNSSMAYVRQAKRRYNLCLCQILPAIIIGCSGNAKDEKKPNLVPVTPTQQTEQQEEQRASSIQQVKQVKQAVEPLSQAQNDARYEQKYDVKGPVVNAGSLQLYQVTDASITVTFNEGADNRTPKGKIRYRLYFATKDMKNLNEIDNHSIGGSSAKEGVNQLMAKGLSPGQSYFLNVVAFDQAGNRTIYKSIKATTDLLPVPGNSGLLQLATENGLKKLSWSAASGGSNFIYKTYYSYSSKMLTVQDIETNGKLIYDSDPSDLSVSFSDPKPSKIIFLNVIAINNNGYKTPYLITSYTSDANIYIGFLDNDNDMVLFDAKVGGAWQGTVEVDNSGLINTTNNSQTGLVQIGNGDFYLAYHDPVSRDGMIATGGLDGFTINSYESIGNAGYNPDLLINQNGDPVIFASSGGDAKYYFLYEGIWTSQTIALGAGNQGYYNRVAMDSAGKFHHCSYDTTLKSLTYATNASGAWNSLEIHGDLPNTIGTQCDIAIDPQGFLHIIYIDYTSTHMRYATNSSGAWQHELLDDSGNFRTYYGLSLKSDANGVLHASYYNESTRDLHYRYFQDGLWSDSTIIDGNNRSGYYSYIELDSLNRPHIAYWEGNCGCLKIARYNPDLSHWEIETVSDTRPIPSSDYGRWPSMILE